MNREEARTDLMLAQADIFYRPKDETIDVAIKALENQKTGYWIIYRLVPDGYDHIKCSVCGQYWSVADHSKFFKYCFNCGAKMEGE